MVDATERGAVPVATDDVICPLKLPRTEYTLDQRYEEVPFDTVFVVAEYNDESVNVIPTVLSADVIDDCPGLRQMFFVE